jgi:hypothetical protein
MERLLFPGHKKKYSPQEGRLVRWLTEEGTPLRSHLPLFIVQEGSQLWEYRFCRDEQNLVVTQRVASEGQLINRGETLALVGQPEEIRPSDMPLDDVASYGTDAFLRKKRRYFSILRAILAVVFVLMVLNMAGKMWSSLAHTPQPGIMLVLNWVTSLAFLPIAFVFTGICLLLMFLPEPEDLPALQEHSIGIGEYTEVEPHTPLNL